jgi:hypothetical protein
VSSAITVTPSLVDGPGLKPHIGSGFAILRSLPSETLQCDADLPTQQLFNTAAIAKRGKSDRHTLATSITTTQSRLAKRRILRARVIMDIRIFGGAVRGYARTVRIASGVSFGVRRPAVALLQRYLIAESCCDKATAGVALQRASFCAKLSKPLS